MDASSLFLPVILSLLHSGNAQFGTGNANSFVDSLLTDLAKSSKDNLQLDDEKFILIVDLLLFSPELHLELKDGELQGLHSLARSSDALVSYDETKGSPVFTISSSLILTNVSMASKAQGKINSLGFGLTLPNIKQRVLMEAVEFGLIIDVDIKDISNLKVATREVKINDIGHIDVKIIGLTPELDSLVSPISTLVVNTVKRDLQTLVTPMIKQTLDGVLKKNAPKDITQIFG